MVCSLKKIRIPYGIIDATDCYPVKITNKGIIWCAKDHNDDYVRVVHKGESIDYYSTWESEQLAFRDLILMPYVGLKDEKSKKIYCKDICKVHIFTQELGENMGVSEGEKEFIAEIDFSPETGVFLKCKNGDDSGPLFCYNGLRYLCSY